MQEVVQLLKKEGLEFKKDKIVLTLQKAHSIELEGKKYKSLFLNDFKADDEKIDIYFFEKLKIDDYIYIINSTKNALILTKYINQQNIFTGSYPIFRVKEKPVHKHLKVYLKEKKIKKRVKYIHTQIGYGALYMYLFVIINKNTLKVSEQIIKKLSTLGYPKGFRIKIFFIHENDKYFLKDIIDLTHKKPVFSILLDKGFIENTLPIVYKYNANILLNKKMLQATSFASKRNISSFSFETFSNFDYLNFSYDTIWLYPKIHDFHLRLLPEKKIHNIATSIYSFLKFFSKYLIKYDYGKHN